MTARCFPEVESRRGSCRRWLDPTGPVKWSSASSRLLNVSVSSSARFARVTRPLNTSAPSRSFCLPSGRSLFDLARLFGQTYRLGINRGIIRGIEASLIARDLISTSMSISARCLAGLRASLDAMAGLFDRSVVATPVSLASADQVALARARTLPSSIAFPRRRRLPRAIEVDR